MKKIFAIIVSIALLVALMPFGVFAEDEIYTIGDKQYTYGDVLYENDFEDETVGSLPEGIDAGMPAGVSWIGGDGKTTAAVQEKDGNKTLGFSGTSCDGILSFPKLNTRNYIFEVEVYSTADNAGSFGVVNGMNAPAATTQSAVTTQIYQNAATAQPRYRYHGTASASGSQGNFTIPANPVMGETVTLKLVSLLGVNYLYYNEELVATYLQHDVGASDYAGMYSCNGYVLLDNVKITAIDPIGVDVPEAPKYEVGSKGEVDGVEFKYGEKVYSYDFEDETIDTLPEGFDQGIPSYVWNSNGFVDAKVYKTANAGKVLTVGTGACDGIVSLPEINTRNYVFEADVFVNHNNNSNIGIANNMPGGPNVSNAVIFSKIPTNANTAAPLTTSKYAEGATGIPDKSFAISTGNPKSGETFKVKIISLEGTSYLFYNGELVVSYPNIHRNSETDTVGFVGCYSYFHIDNVCVTAIEPINDGKLIHNANGSYYVKGEELYYTDFEEFSAGALPEGFACGTPPYAWNGGGSCSASIWQGSDANGRVLAIGGHSCDAVVSIPSVNTQNYIYETNVVITTTNNASLGLINDFQGGYGVANGYSYFALRINAHPDSDNYSTKQQSGWAAGAAGNFDVPNPVNKDVVNLKLISLEGINYVYVNGEFAVSYRQPNRDFDYDTLGFYGCNAWFNVIDIKVTEISTVDFAVEGAQLKVEDGKASLDVEFAFDANNSVYKSLVEAGTEIKFGALIADKSVADTSNLSVDTEGVNNVILEKANETENAIDFAYTIENIPNEMLNHYYYVRPYVAFGEEVYYGITASYNAVKLSNIAYINADEEGKSEIEAVFKNIAGYKGASGKSVTFGLFSDFHYIEGGYISSISNMNDIMKRAYENNASFVISGGDMCNDFKGSPELVNAFKNNEYGLPVYNVYGNHELEGAGNTMMLVTPTLTNDENVIWGTEDGKMGIGYIGYYYVDRDGFRLIFLDTNYSYNTELDIWEHNKPASWSSPSGNINSESLGPDQLVWLEEVLMDAAEKDIPCIVTAHTTFSSKIELPSRDAAAVREIYRKVNTIQPGTVLMSINGHIHTDTNAFEDGVFYLDTNTTRNLGWQAQQVEHYTQDHTFMLEKYDDKGNLIEIVETPVSSLTASKNTWFTADPLSAVVTVNENGVVVIDGTESTWLYDITWANASPGSTPTIVSGVFYDPDAGHLWEDDYTSDETHHWHECVNVYCPCEKELCDSYAEHTFDQKVQGDSFKVEGSANAYYMSCVCGAKGEETFKTDAIVGDVDGNGSVDVADLALLKKTIARLVPEDQAKNPDVDSNGSIDAADLAYLKKKIAKLI